MSKTKNNLFGIAVGAILLAPFLVWARDISQIDYPSLISGYLPSLPNYINILYIFALAAGALILFYVLVMGGFKIFLSSGAPKVQQAVKSEIWAAIIGLLILFSASLILFFVNPTLTNLQIPGLATTIMPRGFRFANITSTTIFLPIPVGQIIEESIFSKNFMASQGKMLQSIKTSTKLREAANKTAQDLYDEIRACECGDKEEGSCPKGHCNLNRIASLRGEFAAQLDNLKVYNEKNKGYLKSTNENLGGNPRFAFNQLALIANLLQLAGPDNIENYYSFLALRESSGQNKNYLITSTSAFATTTDIVQPWSPFWERKKYDPMTFYIVDSTSTAKIFDQLAKIKKTLNIDPFSPAKDVDPSAPPDSGEGFIPPPNSTDVMLFKQIGKSWSGCYRGSGLSVGDSGCADMSLAMAINYWYRRYFSVRQKWDFLLSSNPPPRSFTDFGRECSDDSYISNRTSLTDKIPRPYDVLYYMSSEQYRINNGDWNMDRAKRFLNEIGLNLYTIRDLSAMKNVDFGERLDFDEIKTITNDYGYPVVLFCDLFGDNRNSKVSGHRDCSGGEGTQTCNHYVLASYVTKENILYINDPAAWFAQNDEAESGYKGLNRARYDAWQCGKVYSGSDQPFIIFPR